MQINIDAISHTGSVRDHNEDMILVQGEFIRDSQLQIQVEPSESQAMVVAVADGMGGHNGGEFASELAVDSLDDFVHNLPKSLDDEALKKAFDQWIQDIHQKVVSKGNELPEFYNMGTTIVGLLVYETRIYWFNVGDSRLYRYRDHILSQLSTDHSARNMIDSNSASNLICNSIGAGKDVFIDFFPMNAVFDDDVFLLCSDGLNDMVDDDKIEQLLSENKNAEDLVSEANLAGGKDNVSVIKIVISDKSEKESVDVESEEEEEKNVSSVADEKSIDAPKLDSSRERQENEGAESEQSSVVENRPSVFVWKEERREELNIVDKIKGIFKHRK